MRTDNLRVEPTIFLMEKLSFSLKLFSRNFYGQSLIKTVRGPYVFACRALAASICVGIVIPSTWLSIYIHTVSITVVCKQKQF